MKRSHGGIGITEKVRTAVHEVLTADPAAPSLVRHALLPWLGELSVPRTEIQDLLLATSEAVANVVDHAYATADTRGEVTVTAELHHWPDNTRRVIITVSDAGCWRPPPIEKGFRGRGLPMMRGCTDSLRIETSTAGTHVIMVSHPI
jgi:serine/threonine-protein kinase RsbW